MSSAWPEVISAKSENRHEIKLSGAVISDRISKEGLDPHLFSVNGLNLLTISDTCLKKLPDDICQLRNLLSLLLFSNEIDSFNASIYKLSKLKVLDFSRNSLKSLPDGLGSLNQLTSINFSSNKLTSFPSISNLPCLISLDLSNNALDTFPDVCYAENVHLSDIKINGNGIVEIPGAINQLPVLKNFDISLNQVKLIPQEVAEIQKLKDINLKDNPIADNRLLKLVNQCRTKQIVDYVRQNCPKAGAEPAGKGGKKGKKGQQNKKQDGGEAGEDKEDPVENLCHKMHVLHFADDTINVKITEEVKSVRPHIVCCIVRGLSFTEESFKKFIQMQTKLHDSVCEKRNAATIATHDLAKLPPGDLLYTAKPPQRVVIQPLTRSKNYTGHQLFTKLQQEAENLRKEKKRNVYSGIHKYLYLLEGKQLYPCLSDSADNVISFPPITNSELTKMSHDTTSMLVEVTSAQNQTICRKVLDTFLLELLNMGAGGAEAQSQDGKQTFHKLEVQQVKIVDLEGKMKVVYPSKVDLFYEEQKDTIKIIRTS